MYEDMVKKVDEQIKNPLPTPSVGTPVNWFEKNEEGLRSAALVTKVLGPGKLELIVFKPRHHPIHKQGVLWRGDPIHEIRANPATVASGSWDYLNDAKPPKDDYQYHLDRLREQRDGILREKQAREEDAARLMAARVRTAYQDDMAGSAPAGKSTQKATN